MRHPQKPREEALLATRSPWLRVPSLLLLLAAGLSPALHAQTQNPPAEGVTFGNYNVRQSVELGWRFDDRNGSDAMYNTLVNLHGGPRVLDQSLDMHALNFDGAWFDTLSLSSFGYGGDPNAASRLRVQKRRWYNLAASFRRSTNFWDYDLFANPLNPPTSQPAVAVSNSPHSFDMVRRMGDVNLILMPQSRVRARLGWAHASQTGPAFDSVHQGAILGVEVLLLEPWQNRQETYNAGLDVKLHHANLSFDEFVNHISDARSAHDAAMAFQLPNGVPFDLGLVFDTGNGQPCFAPVANPATQPPTADPTCAGASTFTRSAGTSATDPTEQLTFENDSLRSLEITGRAMYSSSDLRLPMYGELFAGFIPLEDNRQSQTSANAHARRVSRTVDLGATWEARENVRLQESFRFAAYDIPGDLGLTQANLFALSATAAIVSGCKPPFTPVNCPIHSGLSAADSLTAEAATFLGQRRGWNQLELQYDAAKWAGIRVGHRFTKRTIDTRNLTTSNELFLPLLPTRNDCGGHPVSADGSCSVTVSDASGGATVIRENTLLLGGWVAAKDRLRASFDMEWGGASAVFTRIDPRRRQQFRGRISGKPAQWAELALYANRNDGTDNAADVQAGQHHRNVGATAMLTRGSRWSLQLLYDYSRDQAHALICYTLNSPAPGAPPCPTAPQLLQATSFDREGVHFARGWLQWQPVKRVTATAGASVMQSAGSFLDLNTLQVPGSLRSRFVRPEAAIAVALSPRMTWKAAWGEHRYDEDSPVGPTAPRNFRTELVTMSLRYGF